MLLWDQFSEVLYCFSVKQGLMKALVNEQQKSVKTAIGQVIGVLLRHEIPENSWPEAMEFIQQTTTSQSISDKEVEMIYLLK